MQKIEVFYSQLCGACHDAMDYFTERGVPFESYEVKWRDGDWLDDENGRRFKARFGDADFVPQIMIGDRHVKGWKELSGLIERGEIDSLLQG
jgi:glutaredoxin 3